MVPGVEEGVEPRARLGRQQGLREADRVEAEAQRLGADRPLYDGRIAVASISTRASGSTNAPTSTSVMAGKCRPITAR